MLNFALCKGTEAPVNMNQESTQVQQQPNVPPDDIRHDIINYDDIIKIVPALNGHKRLVDRVMHWLWLDKCNDVHERWCHYRGAVFAQHLVKDEFRFQLRVDNEQILADMPPGAFITVSNHPFGSYDGIILLALVGKYRPDFKVMVNLILNQIQAMRESFIAVDALATDDPEKKKVSMHGIREALRQLKTGHPVGFFPAGAVSKIDRHLKTYDRPWQPTVIRLIQQAKAPVVPVFFHGRNSMLFNILGMIDWRLRTLRLPRELFNMTGKTVHVSIGEPISVEQQLQYRTVEELGRFLREKTYQLREQYK